MYSMSNLPSLPIKSDEIGEELLTPFGREQVSCSHILRISPPDWYHRCSILVSKLGRLLKPTTSHNSYDSSDLRVKYGFLLDNFTALPVFRTTSQNVSYLVFSERFFLISPVENRGFGSQLCCRLLRYSHVSDRVPPSNCDREFRVQQHRCSI